MEDSRTSQKFLEELWTFANRVKEAVEGYKVVIREYQIATYYMSSAKRSQHNSIKASEFYKTAIMYVEAAEEPNKEEEEKKPTPKAPKAKT